jgi:cytochrome c-type protein NapC
MECDFERGNRMENEKKPNFISGIWQAVKGIDWSNPVNKWKAIFFGSFGLVLVIGIMVGALSATNSKVFCGFCHEMTPEIQTVKMGAHSGAACVDCHIAPGPYYEMVFHKIKSLKEVYYHVVGVPNPIHQHEHEAVLNETCLRCHSVNRIVSESGDLKAYHQGHIEEGVLCINCHAGVAHGKVAERGLIYSDLIDKWDSDEAAANFVTEKDRRPNMGTCIECHTKVNEGEKPYLELNYAVPMMKENHKDLTQKATMIYENVQNSTGKAKTQSIILDALGKEKHEAKISMACETCHKAIKTPSNHEVQDWGHNHGGSAMTSVQECMDCHKDTLWVRRMPQVEDVDALALGKTKAVDNTVATPTVVKEKARNNEFCSTCHSNRPFSHNENGWLLQHATSAKSSDQKANCYVCHDRLKDEGAITAKASTDVYCEYCHRQGFKDEK